MLISLLEVCQEGGVLRGGTWRMLRVPDNYLEDRVILDVVDDFVFPKGRYSESFVLKSLLEVCQEWGVLPGGTLRTLRVPDRRLGGQGHSLCHE